MSKVSKAFKAFNGLNDEEKLELEDLFKVEEVVEQKDVPKVKVPKVETKVEEKPKEEPEVEESELKKLFSAMTSKIEKLEEKITKQTPFGAKQKQQSSKDGSEFDDLFAKLRSGQRS